MTHAEVLVVGAGPAGAATATHLAESGVDVLLLDRVSFPREKACAEFLSPGAVALLDELDVVDGAASAGAWQDGMRIASPGGSFTLRYRGGRRALGVRRSLLDALLLERARDAGARVRENAGVAAAVVDGGGVTGVRLRGGGELRSHFVVAADGLRSPVARSLGLELPPPWPRRVGLVAHVRGSRPSRFGLMAVGPSAYCGVASVGGGESSVGVGLAPRARRRAEPVDELFDRAVASLTPARAALAGSDRVSPIRGIAPLSRRVSRVAGAGFLLVGDAAGFTDPFTGEGVHRALRGAVLAADAVRCALRRKDRVPVGYEEARRDAFAAKERACLLLQAALARPALFDYCLRRASRERIAHVLAGVFGDYLPARAALRPSVVAELVRP